MPEANEELDYGRNRTHISNAMTQGIFQREAIPNIAPRLERVTNMDYNAAKRTAKTAMTATECAGRLDSNKRAQNMGIDLQQEWMATLDNRTRHEHRILDGQRVNVGEKFKVGRDEIEYPGDPNAPGYLIYNCRCTLVAAVSGHDQRNASRHSRLCAVSYLVNDQEGKRPTEVGAVLALLIFPVSAMYRPAVKKHASGVF